MIERLRPKHSPERLARLYPTPHDHALWGRGHSERVEETIRLGKRLKDTRPEVLTVADLSCGNAKIARAFTQNPVLGDLAPGYALCGPIEETLPEIPQIHLFVLCETLEHLDDPFAVLKAVRTKCDYLLLSTPIDNFDDPNEEHYWSWTQRDVTNCLWAHDYDLLAYSQVDSRPYGEAYCYGIWLLE